MLVVSEYHHDLGSWAVYPRPYYFKKRFEDLFSRYQNITSNATCPSLFENKKLTATLETLKGKLESNLQVIVIGRGNLQTEDFVIATDPLRRESEEKASLTQKQGKSTTTTTTVQKESGITAVICYAKIDKCDGEGLQEVVDTVERFTYTQEKVEQGSIAPPFIFCQTTTTKGEDNILQFRSDILSTVENKFGIKLGSENVIIGLDGDILSDKISRSLETKIVQGIIDIGEHLRTFISDNRHLGADEYDILESEHFVKTIQGFLRNGLAFVDMLEDTGDDPFIKTLLRNLARVTRCAVLTPLSAKSGLLIDICNVVAHELKFEDELIQKISRNTRYHLSNMQEPCKDMVKATKSGDKGHHFPGGNFIFIAYPIRDNIRETVKQLEEKLEHTAVLIKKMLFEIKGYIKQSFVKAEYIQTDKKSTIPDMLRKDILAIHGVYGIGTIYDEVQIHVMDGEKTAAQDAISETMDLFQFHQPYRVRRVLNIPKMLCRCGTGACIKSEQGASGTLGGFVKDNDDRLYGLTSAHVVQGERDIFIINEAQRRHRFARSHPDWTVSGDNDGFSIDIAAVQVFEQNRHQCMLSLKDDNGTEKRSELCIDTPRELSQKVVHKFGAATDKTMGIICSDDYSVKQDETKDFLVLIDNLPGGPDDDKYALPGDSGSINCILDISSNPERVKAVSMISAGEFMLEGDTKGLCVSFLLYKGIQKLKEACGKEFTFSS